MSQQPNRFHVVVAGTTFGRKYLEAVEACPGAELVGILGRGSERTKRVAARAGVPLYTDPAELPVSVDVACVAVRADVVGGSGTTLARRLLERGISVLQELPVSESEVASCLRIAAASGRGSEGAGAGVVYAVADFYLRLPAVQAFLGAAHELAAAEPILAISGHCSVQVGFPLAGILAELPLLAHPARLAPVADSGGMIAGHLGSTAVNLQCTTALDPVDTDNNVQFPALSLHTAAGVLRLADVHGPVTFTPTLRLPETTRSSDRFPAAELTTPAAEELYSFAGSQGDCLAEQWPQAMAHEIAAVAGAEGTLDPARAQRTLAAAAVWENLNRGAGFPTPMRGHIFGGEQQRTLIQRLRAAARPLADTPSTTNTSEGRNE